MYACTYNKELVNAKHGVSLIDTHIYLCTNIQMLLPQDIHYLVYLYV